MTRLAVMSDLHIDLNHFETYEIDTLIKCLKNQKVSHLHIAGDISNHFSIDTKPFLRKLSKEVKVSYNLGNHDMLDLDTNNLIVAMHFVPHSRFTMTHERFKPFNAYLGSEQFHQIFVKHGVKDVVFGHAHRSYGTVTIDGVTYHSRPLGYRREWDLTIDFVSNHPELNPTGTWNLSKRYNLVKKRPEFLEYEKKELANEFLSSMTLFDL